MNYTNNRYLIVLALMLSSSTAFAWTPCMPFCDGTCSVPQINSLASQFSSGITGLGVLHQSQLQQNRTSIDGFAKRISAEIVRNTKAATNLHTHIVNSLAETNKEITAAKNALNVHDQLDESSQPASGVVGSCKTEALKTAFVQNKQITTALNTQLRAHNDSEPGSKRILSRQIAKLATKDDDHFNPIPIIHANTLTQGQIDKLTFYITAITNPDPLPKMMMSDVAKSNAMGYELHRRIWNVKQQIVQDILVTQITSRSPTMPSDWVEAYAGTKPTGNISLYEAFDREISGRLSTPGWFLDIKQKNQSGLKREMVYLKSIENRLLYEIAKRKAQRNRILAIKAAIAIAETKPTRQ